MLELSTYEVCGDPPSGPEGMGRRWRFRAGLFDAWTQGCQSRLAQRPLLLFVFSCCGVGLVDAPVCCWRVWREERQEAWCGVSRYAPLALGSERLARRAERAEFFGR